MKELIATICNAANDGEAKRAARIARHENRKMNKTARAQARRAEKRLSRAIKGVV